MEARNANYVAEDGVDDEAAAERMVLKLEATEANKILKALEIAADCDAEEE